MTTGPLTRDEMAAKLRQENPRFAEYEATMPEIAERHLNGCMAEQERDIREPWRNLTFDRSSEARGRNGWFTLNDGTVFVYQGSGHLRLNAKQKGKNSPIAVNFGSIEDMRLLGRALTQAAEAWEDLADPANASVKEAYRQAAIEQYAKDGEIEIDSNAVVSQGDDAGAYVQSWVLACDPHQNDETATEEEQN